MRSSIYEKKETAIYLSGNIECSVLKIKDMIWALINSHQLIDRQCGEAHLDTLLTNGGSWSNGNLLRFIGFRRGFPA